MKAMLCLVMAVLYFTPGAGLALEGPVSGNGSGSAGSVSMYVAVPPKYIPQPNIEPPPGIINPDFNPSSEYCETYDCRHFATEYCEQFPGGAGNCFIMLFCGFGGEAACHAANVTRVRLEDGRYLYCVVEPQANTVVPGSCWIGGSRYPRSPEHLDDPLCRFYRLDCEEGDDGRLVLPDEPYPPHIRRRIPESELSQVQ